MRSVKIQYGKFLGKLTPSSCLGDPTGRVVVSKKFK